MKRMRAGFVLVLSSVLALACGGGARTGSYDRLPEFRLAALDGTEVSNADYAGHVVLFDVWATWCGPCHVQADILRRAAPGLEARGVKIVGINSGESLGVVRDFVAKRPFPWPVLVDSEERLTGDLEILGLPTLLIVDRDGKIAFRQTGIASADRIDAELAKILG